MNCPQCGNPVDVGQRYCPKCSALIEPPSLWQRFLAALRSTSKPRHVVNVKRTVTIKTSEFVTNQQGERHVYH